MSLTRQDNEIFIRATPEQVRPAIPDTAFTARYFHETSVESSFDAGAGIRYLLPDGSPAIEGEIEEVEPGRRFVMTFRFVYDTALAAEPPSRVEWIVTPAGDVTRLTLRHGDLFRSPLTWEQVRMGWLPVLHGLKSVLETGEGLGRVDDPAAATLSEDPEGDWHRTQGITANNAIWDLLAIPDGERTEDDDERMTATAYAALYHWGLATGTGPVNTARGHYMVAKTWVARGNGPMALHHAAIVMATCLANDLADFDLAYAHEIRARALALLGRTDEARVSRTAAAEVPVVDPEDRAIVEADLAQEPWFDT